MIFPILGKYAINSWVAIQILESIKSKSFNERKRAMRMLPDIAWQSWNIDPRYSTSRLKIIKLFFNIDKKEIELQKDAIYDIERYINYAYGKDGEIEPSSDELTSDEEFLFDKLSHMIIGFSYSTMDEQIARGDMPSTDFYPI